MNNITFQFHGGLLHKTDYYQSTDCRRGLAWLGVHEKVWHILLPGAPRSTRCVQAGPIEDPEEPEGWSWCLDIDGQSYPLPLSRIHGERPNLPDRGHYLKRTAVLYTGSGPRLLFHTNAPGLQSTAHQVWLTNGMKVGYKPRGHENAFR